VSEGGLMCGCGRGPFISNTALRAHQSAARHGPFEGTLPHSQIALVLLYGLRDIERLRTALAALTDNQENTR